MYNAIYDLLHYTQMYFQDSDTNPSVIKNEKTVISQSIRKTNYTFYKYTAIVKIRTGKY